MFPTIKFIFYYLQDFSFYELEFNGIYTNNQVKLDGVKVSCDSHTTFTDLFHHTVF